MTWTELQVFLKGKVFLIGFTFVDKNGKTIEKFQTSGTVTELLDDAVIVFLRSDKSVFQVPFESETIVKASAGDYEESETGRKIVNPDFRVNWKITIEDPAQMEKIKKNGYFI